MMKISGPTAVDNRFSAGTILTVEWLNSVQDEIVNVLKARGIEPDKDDPNQLIKAIEDIATFGPKSLVFELPNNRVDFPLEGLSFDSKKIVGVSFYAHIQRYSDTETDISYVAQCYAACNTFLKNTWKLSYNWIGGDGRRFLEFGIKDGQIVCTVKDISGANYKGTLRVSSLRLVRA